jgi:CRISPR-associated endonuclease/helicase Cas3
VNIASQTKPIAHSCVDARAGDLVTHSLSDHLTQVASLARAFAEGIPGSRIAYLAGLWHDLGKYRPGFQRYIRQSVDAHIEGRVPDRSKTHSAAGALWARKTLVEQRKSGGEFPSRVLQYLIAGHHAGLDNWHDGLGIRLASEDSRLELQESLAAMPDEDVLNPALGDIEVNDIPVDRVGDIPGGFALSVRMLFSCLVDADFLDTEMFMDCDRSAKRSGSVGMDQMLVRFDRHMHSKQDALRESVAANTPVNRVRDAVLRACREKAQLLPGTFTLTVPTGGGKTLSSLAFALEHAVCHGKRRVIYAIPYTSIIEQTAGIFRGIFGDADVIEHHSNVDAAPERETQRSRLACENWDAPLVVTTNVQLFESLFARRTSRCRKLHNIANSVLVLDEAQLLPVEFLQPVIDVLRLLVRNFGVTVVLCTATQPSLSEQRNFDPRRGPRGYAVGEVVEIVDDVPTMYQAMRRVQVHLPESLAQSQSWASVANGVVQEPAVLAIVNRRADARTLYTLLKQSAPTIGTGLWHLSALMCPQHRSDTLAEIRVALAARRAALARGEKPEPVRVVSTQLIEAGVDVDFPVVFRALAGLDSIAQAAGRCNREGLLDTGVVCVFVPESDPPPGLLRQARDTCRTIWHDRPDDPLSLDLFPVYFRRLYGDAHSLDKAGIVDALRLVPDKTERTLPIRFRDAADGFRLIDDKDGATVLVRYKSAYSNDNLDALLFKLEREGPQRWLMRKLQRYGVTVYQHDLDRLVRFGDVRELSQVPGLYVQVSDVLYDPMFGVNVDGAPGDPASYVV